jgi:hypothetical protein
MKRLVIAALVAVAVCVVAATALAAKSNVIYDTTSPNGPPTNEPSFGPEAYGFTTIGDKINLQAGTPRTLSNATVTLSSWACQQGSWQNQTCLTEAGATFSEEITLSIWDEAHTTQLATSTQTFDIPYRPSASPKCLEIAGNRPGGWYQPSTKTCKNGLTKDVTFNFPKVTLPDTVNYEISYNTNHYGPTPTGTPSPSDSLNVAVTPADASVGSDSAGANEALLGGYTPMVQFKASNGS